MESRKLPETPSVLSSFSNGLKNSNQSLDEYYRDLDDEDLPEIVANLTNLLGMETRRKRSAIEVNASEILLSQTSHNNRQQTSQLLKAETSQTFEKPNGLMVQAFDLGLSENALDSEVLNSRIQSALIEQLETMASSAEDEEAAQEESIARFMNTLCEGE